MLSKVEMEDVVMGGSRFTVSFTIHVEGYDSRCPCGGTLTAYHSILDFRQIMEIRKGVPFAYDGIWVEKLQETARATYLARAQSACGVTQLCDNCSDSDQVAE